MVLVIRDNIVSDVIREDSTKISTTAFICKEIGIRDEQVLPMMAKMLKSYKDGEIPTKKEVDSIARRTIARF